MKIYQLEYLSTDGGYESNGYYLHKSDAEAEKHILDKEPYNVRYGVKQTILTHNVFDGTTHNQPSSALKKSD